MPTTALLRLTLLLLPAVAALAQMGSVPRRQQAAPVNPEDRGSIEGTVVNAGTGEPIRKAQVTAVSLERGGARESAATDSSGRFTIEGVDPGRWRLLASRNGFAESRGGSQQTSTIVTVAAKQKVRNIVLKLAPAAVISGRVLDEDGEPMLYVQVQALRITYGRGGRRLAPADSATTDDQGQYRLFGLRAGNYFVRAMSPGAAVARGLRRAAPGDAQDEGYAPQFYPGALDTTQAIVIPVRAGDEQHGIDFRFTPTRMVRVRGRVAGAAGGRGRGIMVGLASRREGASESPIFTGSDDTGAFEIRGVVPGSYDLIAFQGGREGAMSAWRQIEVGESNVDGIELALKPGADLKGQVRVEASGSGITPPSAANARISLSSDGPSMPFNAPRPATVEEDGSFVLNGAGEGVYRLDISPLPADCYIKSIRAGGVETVDGRIVVGSSGSGLIEVVLSAAGGRIEGTATDGDHPVADATVVLAPDGARRDRYGLYLDVKTDQSGHFAFSGVAPGSYTLLAWDEIESGAWRDPAVLDRYSKQGKQIRVDENSRQSSVEVAVIRAGAN
jgi:hypothetical protein